MLATGGWWSERKKILSVNMQRSDKKKREKQENVIFICSCILYILKIQLIKDYGGPRERKYQALKSSSLLRKEKRREK